MNKIALVTLLVVLLSLVLAGMAFAQAETSIIKGTITALGGGTLTLESKKDGTVAVAFPSDFNAPHLVAGDTVMVKGVKQADGSILATTLHVLAAKGKGQGQGNGRPENPGKASSAFCSKDKQDQPHPLAVKIAEGYGVSADLVTEFYCDGQSMGAIMLALKTVQLKGGDAATLLDQRAGGLSWGKIWQDSGLIASEKSVKTPPGKLNKPADSGKP